MDDVSEDIIGSIYKDIGERSGAALTCEHTVHAGVGPTQTRIGAKISV